MNPLFTSWKPDEVGLILNTGFMRFTTAHGIDGLARTDTESGVDFLAVHASNPGTGQFRVFIQAAKKSFKRIGVWHDENPIIGAALQRYGFHRARFDELGEVIPGWEWRHEV